MRAFMKKEWMEWSRTGRLLVLVLVFAVLGILNPALARLTPWMMEILSESLAETGVSEGDTDPGSDKGTAPTEDPSGKIGDDGCCLDGVIHFVCRDYLCV